MRNCRLNFDFEGLILGVRHDQLEVRKADIRELEIYVGMRDFSPCVGRGTTASSGPKRPFTSRSIPCGVASQTGLSPRCRNPDLLELTHRGLS